MSTTATSRKNNGSGFPSPAEDWLEPRLRLDDLIEHPASTFMVRVRGGAMAGEGISEGDVLVVDRAVRPRSGAVVVAFAAGEMVVRRIELSPGAVMLNAADGSPPHRLAPEEGDLIWGVVRYGIYSLAT
ncbi:MAG: S24 family peptidase [Rhodothermales bacterium]